MNPPADERANRPADERTKPPGGARATPPTHIDHLGVAVLSLAEAIPLYRDVLGLEMEGATEEVADQKVRVAFFRIGQTRIELLEPTAADSPIAAFIEKRGPGLHHIAYHVEDLEAALAGARAAGLRLIDEEPRAGAHGMKIAFVHPKATFGVLTEFCEPAGRTQ